MKSFLLSFSFHCIVILCIFFFNKSFIDKSENFIIVNDSNLELFEIVNHSKIKILKNKEYKKIKTEVNKTETQNKVNKITSIYNKASVIQKSKILNQPQSQSYENQNVETQKTDVPLIKKSINEVSIDIKNNKINISKKYGYSTQIYKKSLKSSFQKLNSCRVMKKNQNNLYLRKQYNFSLNDFNKININQLLNKNNKYNNLILQKTINITKLLKQNDRYHKLLFEKKINVNQLLHYKLNDSQSLFCSN